MEIEKTLEDIRVLKEQLAKLEKLAIEAQTEERLKASKEEPKVRVHTFVIEVHDKPYLPWYLDSKLCGTHCPTDRELEILNLGRKRGVRYWVEGKRRRLNCRDLMWFNEPRG